MPRQLLATIALAIAVPALLVPHLASSAPAGDPRAERDRLRSEQEQVRAQRAEVAARIDTSKASLAEIGSALTALDANLQVQRAALARTEAELADAEHEIARTDTSIHHLSTRVQTLRTEVRARAVAAFVNPTDDDVLSVLDSHDFTSAANQKFYVELRSLDDADLADRLDGAGADLAHTRREAAAARARAQARRTEQAARATKVEAARAAQQRLSDRLSADIRDQVGRSLQLAGQDRALSAKIAEEAARRAFLAAQREAEQAAKVPAAGTADGGGTDAGGGGAGEGGGGGPALPPATGGGTSTGEGGISLCTVGGITVDCRIEPQLRSMLDAARADGLVLTASSSYRSLAQQLSLRRDHCGTSHYAIYDMPASSCHPQTAKPGHSQHQLGLAIDFASCSHSSRCFGWLSANASRFGFYNLPAESWHWSTSGR